MKKAMMVIMVMVMMIMTASYDATAENGYSYGDLRDYAFDREDVEFFNEVVEKGELIHNDCFWLYNGIIYGTYSGLDASGLGFDMNQCTSIYEFIEKLQDYLTDLLIDAGVKNPQVTIKVFGYDGELIFYISIITETDLNTISNEKMGDGYLGFTYYGMVILGKIY